DISSIVADVEWARGPKRSKPDPKRAGGILGQHVMPQVGDHVVVLDPQLARWLVEPTGTILEVRCDGGHVKVEHDGAAREERYYNTGKDGVYQLALAPPMPSLVADPRPRFSWLPRPPSKVEVKAASNVSQAASNTIQQRPRYSEVRRSGSQSRQPTVAAAAEPQVETAARTGSARIEVHGPVTLNCGKRDGLQCRGCAVGRPWVKHQRRESVAKNLMGQVWMFGRNYIAELICEALRQPTDSLRQEYLQPPTAVDEMPGWGCPVLPKVFGVEKGFKKPGEAVRNQAWTLRRSPTAPSETSVPKPATWQRRETTLLTKQLKELKASKQSVHRSLAVNTASNDRHLEVCEERLRQHFEAETRQLLEMAERQILGEVKERSLKMLRSCGSPDRSSGPQPSETNEEPEQEPGYETPNGEEEPYYLDKAVGREVTQVGLSRAELADSVPRLCELSLQTIGSIARRVSASLGGRPSGAPATQRALERDNPGDSRRQPAQVQRPKEQKERGFDLEQEMEHLADMRRFASQAGESWVGGCKQLGFQVLDLHVMPRKPSGEIRFGHPVPALRQSALPRTAKAVPCERWRRRPSASRSEAEPPCPWDEEPDTPPRRDARDARPNASNVARQHATAGDSRQVWQHVDSEGNMRKVGIIPLAL
ncbi:unnamed protein product, partial [Cladocopium goreaui]